MQRGRPLPPTQQQLRRHALTMAIPMIGFGFMDNLVMIQAGDYIDQTIGVMCCMSTLTAAAFGQIFSDISGVLSGGVVEAMAARISIPRANLTAEQHRLRAVKLAGTLGAVVGVITGCLLGMVSLLFMDLEKSERLKKQRELRTLYNTLMEEGHQLIGAQHCALFLVSDDGMLTSMGWKGKSPTQSELLRTFSEYDADDSGTVDSLQLYHSLRKLGWTAELADVEQMIKENGMDPHGQLTFDEFSRLMTSAILADEVRLNIRVGGSRHWVLTSGKVLNIQNVETDTRISDESRARYKLRGYDVMSLLLAPVVDQDGQVIGLVELVNKEVISQQGDLDDQTIRRRNSEYGFCKDDEKLLQMLCAHCAIFLKHLNS